MSESTTCTSCGGDGILLDLDNCHCPRGRERAEAESRFWKDLALKKAKALLEREGFKVVAPA